MSWTSAVNAQTLLVDTSGTPLLGVGATPLSERVTNTDGASTALTTFGAAAGLRNYVTAVVLCNSSAATFGTVDFRDGTGGAVLWTVPVPAEGGVVVCNGGAPLFKTTANTALAFDVSTNISTITISVAGFQSA